MVDWQVTFRFSDRCSRASYGRSAASCGRPVVSCGFQTDRLDVVKSLLLMDAGSMPLFGGAEFAGPENDGPKKIKDCKM